MITKFKIYNMAIFYALRKIICVLVAIIMVSQFTSTVNAQKGAESNAISLKLIARPLPDSILLRWAPANFGSWELGNQYGYKIYRYTLIRDSVLLTKPEKKLLTPAPLKPYPMNNWKGIVETNRFAAIAAQALFGQTFKVEAGKGFDTYAIKTKAEEQQQRFSFALYASDMSPVVAKASGLWFTDNTAVKNEKYLYRVMVDIPASDAIKTDTAFVFTGINEYKPLPVPVDFKADFGDRMVKLNWNAFVHNQIYSSWVTERSADNGKTFKQLGDPLVLIAEDGANPELIYKIDSLPQNNKEYQFRVRGTSFFGETGPVSAIVKGMGVEEIPFSPNIVSQYIVKKTVKIVWEFPKEAEKSIAGFRVSRSDNHKAGFKTIADKLKPSLREYIDRKPLPTGYYLITAFSNTGKEKISFPVLVQLTDSIPPIAPFGLQGKVDSSMVAHLTWEPNTEADIYGYKIFRSVSGADEFTQLTHKPFRGTHYSDTLNKKDLNKTIYYKIMAVDQRQNESPFSPVAKLLKPDLIAPSAPVFVTYKASETGIETNWIKSSSTDVKHHLLYRNNDIDTTWVLLHKYTPDNKYDNIEYNDPDTRDGGLYGYKLIATDEGGNISQPALSLKVKGVKPLFKDGIRRIDKKVNDSNGSILLSWPKPEGVIKNYIVYRKKDENNYSTYNSVQGNDSNFEDYGLIAGHTYWYKIKVVYSDGSISRMSEEVEIKY